MSAVHPESLGTNQKILKDKTREQFYEVSKQANLQSQFPANFFSMVGKGINAAAGTTFPILFGINSPFPSATVDLDLGSPFAHYHKISITSDDTTINLNNMIRGRSMEFKLDITINTATFNSITYAPLLENTPTGLPTANGSRYVLEISAIKTSTEEKYFVVGSSEGTTGGGGGGGGTADHLFARYTANTVATDPLPMPTIVDSSSGTSITINNPTTDRVTLEGDGTKTYRLIGQMAPVGTTNNYTYVWFDDTASAEVGVRGVARGQQGNPVEGFPAATAVVTPATTRDYRLDRTFGSGSIASLHSFVYVELITGGGGGGISDPIIQTYNSPTQNTEPTTTDLDASVANVFLLPGISEDLTIDITNPPGAGKYELIHIVFTQDGTGNHTISWDAGITFTNGTPTVTETANAITDVILYTKDQGVTWTWTVSNGGFTGTFANTTLNNLSATSINENLIPQAGKTLGNSANPWSRLNTNKIELGTAGSFVASDNAIIADATEGMEFHTPANDAFRFLFGANLTLPSWTINQTTLIGSDAASGIQLESHLTLFDTAVDNPDPTVNGQFRNVAGDVKVRSGGVVRNLSDIGATTLPVPDTTSIVEGSVTPSKQLRFEVDGFTASTTRVITPPDADINLPGTNIPNTWTANQTHSANILFSDSEQDIGDSSNVVDNIFLNRVRFPNSDSITANAFNILRATVLGVDMMVLNVPTNDDLLITENGKVTLPLPFHLDMSSGILTLDDPILTLKINESDSLNITKADGLAAEFFSNDGYDFDGGDVEFNDNSLTGVSQIDLTTPAGAAVGSIIANDLSTDVLEIRLGAAVDWALTDNGSSRIAFNNTLNTLNMEGITEVQLPTQVRIQDRTTTPSQPTSGTGVLYIFDDGSGNQSLRIKFDNNTAKEIIDDT
jgi:hypothetical protein